MPAIPRRVLLLGSGIFAATTWYAAYNAYKDHIDVSSHFVTQTLFNVSRCLPEFDEAAVSSSVKGVMLQRKGIADITFTIQQSGKHARVHASAMRHLKEWITKRLYVEIDGRSIDLI